MEEMQQSYVARTGDPEATLVQPRFDATEAQTAQPVVPLAPRPYARPRRSLPFAMVLVSALLGGVVSVVAYRLYQRRPQEPRQQQSQSASAQPVAEPVPQGAKTPELTAAVPSKVETAPAGANIVTERRETAPAPERNVGAAKNEEKSAARDENAGGMSRETAGRKRDERDAPAARRVEVIPSYPQGERVGRDSRRDGDEATDYEVPARAREHRGGGSRERKGEQKRRNVDRIRDIFEGPPPA